MTDSEENKSFEINGVEIMLDEDGFMQSPEMWNEEVGKKIAKELAGVPEMTEEHWKLIRYLREYWETFGVCPPIKMIVKKTGITLEKMYELFPDGPAHGACKVAGAPKPTGCV